MLELPIDQTADRSVLRSPTRWRILRGRKQVFRLRRGIEVLALLRGGVEIGCDEVFENLALKLGLFDDAVTLRRYAFGSETVTIVAPTHRAWHRPGLRLQIDALPSLAERLDKTVAIWPPDEVLAQPRLENAIAITTRMTAPVFGDAERLEALLASEPEPIPLSRCTRALPGRGGTERLYGLLTCGRFEIVHDRPLGPDIAIRLRDPGDPPITARP